MFQNFSRFFTLFLTFSEFFPSTFPFETRIKKLFCKLGSVLSPLLQHLLLPPLRTPEVIQKEDLSASVSSVNCKSCPQRTTFTNPPAHCRRQDPQNSEKRVSEPKKPILGGNFGPEKKHLAPPPRQNSPQTPSRPLDPHPQPIKIGKRPIKEGKHGQFSGTPSWWKTATLKRPIKYYAIVNLLCIVNLLSHSDLLW